MPRKRTYTHCQTLRLSEELDDLLAVAAYERRISKAAYVRAALRQFLGQRRLGKEPLSKEAEWRVRN